MLILIEGRVWISRQHYALRCSRRIHFPEEARILGRRMWCRWDDGCYRRLALVCLRNRTSPQAHPFLLGNPFLPYLIPVRFSPPIISTRTNVILFQQMGHWNEILNFTLKASHQYPCLPEKRQRTRGWGRRSALCYEKKFLIEQLLPSVLTLSYFLGWQRWLPELQICYPAGHLWSR